jgi:BirA family biotin operon repressor/biotin-[acetyl-CoA-carboxylase] ligase
MKLISLESVDSTNTYLRSLPEADNYTIVTAHTQTAGRGQRGNSWEAEPGANITLSMLMRPENISADRQFAISRAVALAVADTVAQFLPIESNISVKWPNDIYVDDRKIAGILIENSIAGNDIVRSIIGVGLNDNQTVFVSDAPNPVSLAQLCEAPLNLGQVETALANNLCHRLEAEDAEHGEATAQEYMAHLWRRIGFHPYVDAEGQQFEASIVDVDPMGFITLQHTDGTSTRHAFKEVAAIL